MPNTSVTKKVQLQNWLKTINGPVTVDSLALLPEQLMPLSDQYLRKLLRESGHPLHPLVEGVRQDSFDNLARTLNALEAFYSNGSKLTKAHCRQLVKEAKLHAQMAERRLPGSKQEKIEWMRLWLENPAVFPAWVQLRRRSIETPRSQLE